MDKLMTTEEVSDLLGVPVTTLYQWRHKGSGPRCIRVGRHLRYAVAELERWLDEQAA